MVEGRRVLAEDGRLALSDVVVEGPPPDLPAPIADALCLTGTRDRATLRSKIEEAGFRVADVRDHRAELLSMRDRLAERVDYEGLLGALGEPGVTLLEGVRELESAVESGRVSSVSLVATLDAGRERERRFRRGRPRRPRLRCRRRRRTPRGHTNTPSSGRGPSAWSQEYAGSTQ